MLIFDYQIVKIYFIITEAGYGRAEASYHVIYHQKDFSFVAYCFNGNQARFAGASLLRPPLQLARN